MATIYKITDTITGETRTAEVDDFVVAVAEMFDPTFSLASEVAADLLRKLITGDPVGAEEAYLGVKVERI